MADDKDHITIEQTLAWGDGEYLFRVDWRALKAIESDTDRGPMELLLRLQEGRWMVQELSSIMRHALIGGGTDPGKVQKLLATYVESLPPEVTLPMASGLLYMGLFGFRPGQPETNTEVQADGND